MRTAASRRQAPAQTEEPFLEPDVVTPPASSQALARLDPQALIQKAIESNAGVETMERLMALAKDVRAVQAREAWYEAMAEFQRTCPSIKKTKTASIKKRDGTDGYSYKYAPLDEILSTIQPIMGPLGLSVSWRQKVEGDKVLANCRISHTLGHHEESGDIAMPVQVANAEVGANPMQRVGIATTYAKRYTLLSIIGMAPEDDPDANTGDGRKADAAAGAQGGGERRQAEQRGPGAGGEADVVINDNQLRRLSAIATGAKWTDDQVHDLLTSFQYDSRKKIKVADYEAVCDRLKLGYAAWVAAKKQPAAPQQGTLA